MSSGSLIDQLMPNRRPGFIGGARIIQSLQMVVAKNTARSPSRALRRWRTGKRKVSPFTFTPRKDAMMMPDGTLVMHPEAYYALRNATR